MLYRFLIGQAIFYAMASSISWDVWWAWGLGDVSIEQRGLIVLFWSLSTLIFMAAGDNETNT